MAVVAYFTSLCLSPLDIQLLFEAKPRRGMGNSVALFEIHIIPGYCIGKSVIFILEVQILLTTASLMV